MKEPKTFFLRTYGCQMNELDSEVMIGMLRSRGMTQVEEESEADLLIFNTCWIRDLAARKAMGKIGQVSKRDVLIGVTGCMANAKKEALFDKLPSISFVLGTNNIHHLNTVLDEALQGNQSCRVDPLFHEEIPYVDAVREDSVKASISIIRGCDKFCTYCCVPYTRGREVSRDPAAIEDEVRRLVDKGYKEVLLLGQNVNSYGKDQAQWGHLFHDLLARLDKIEGLERQRFMTSHPVDITRDLMLAIRDLDSVCEFVHFPIQAGSDRILKKMHRLYTKSEYLEKVAMLRELVPDVTLGTDIIVGFPTETDEEFEETLQVFKEIDYQTAFLYSYSPRKGTPSTRWRDDVPEEVKQERLQRLLRYYNQRAVAHRQEMIGLTVEVLVEGKGRDGSGLMGRTRCWKRVLFPGDESLIGTMQQVKLESCNHQTLIGQRVSTGLQMLTA
jgi:tRNA-2-methylthio-N6-dimethylallyladenosine synthase